MNEFKHFALQYYAVAQTIVGKPYKRAVRHWQGNDLRWLAKRDEYFDGSCTHFGHIFAREAKQVEQTEWWRRQLHRVGRWLENHAHYYDRSP